MPDNYEERLKVLFTLDHWHLCEVRLELTNVLWVWHEGCKACPDDEQGMNQESWLPMDDNPVCILCLMTLPDEIQALVTLYMEKV